MAFCCVGVPPETPMHTPSSTGSGAGGFGAYQWRLLTFVCFGWMIDGMEMYVMSLLLPELPDSWGLNDVKRGVLGGSVFVGMTIGAVGFGSVSDRVGRLTVVRITILLALVTGLLCAAAQSMVSLMLMRGAFGVMVGGLLPALITLLTESMPSGAAGASVGLTQNMFAVGGMFVSGIAAAVLGGMGWRWLLFFSGLPLLLCFPFFIPGYILESPMWLAATGRREAADRVVSTIAATNGEPQPALLSVRAVDPPRSFVQQLRQLFGTHKALTLPLMPLWALLSWGYYGIVFVLPTYLNRHIPHESEYIGALPSPSHLHGILPHTTHVSPTPHPRTQSFARAFLSTLGHSHNLPLAHKTLPILTGVLLTALAEIPGCTLGGFAADRIGRKSVMIASFSGSAVMAFVTGVVAILIEQTGVSWIWLLLSACALKSFLSSAFIVVTLYTAEAYPTLVTNFGYGFCNAFTRLSATLTPTVGQMLLDHATSFVTFASYSVGCAAAAVLSAFLPFETLGRNADAAQRATGPKETSPLQK